MLFDLRGQTPPRGAGHLPDAGRADGRRPGAVRHRRVRAAGSSTRSPATTAAAATSTTRLEKRIDAPGGAARGLAGNDRRRWRRWCGCNYQVAVVAAAVGHARRSPRTARTSCARRGAYWERYVKATGQRPEPRPGARARCIIFDTTGLNQPDEGQGRGARDRRATPTTRRPTCCWCSTPTAAGDKRTAQLAAQKADRPGAEGASRSR